MLPLREDETEALRRLVRFVWTSATLVGVVGRARRAAAAAAALRELEESRREPVKAVRAADAADGFAVEELSGGCCRSNKSAWGSETAMMDGACRSECYSRNMRNGKRTTPSNILRTMTT